MKAWSIAAGLAVLFAGCLGAEKSSEEEPVEAASAEPAGPVAEEAAANVTAVEPLTIEGTVWLSPSSGSERVETPIDVPVNASGSTVRATLHLGSRYAVLDVPPVMTDVVVELRDAAGAVLATAELHRGSPDATLEAIAPAAGPHTLMLLSYGGSDERGNGDHVDYVIEVVPSP